MNDDFITCLGYARAWLAVLSATIGASWVGRAGIDWHFAAQSGCRANAVQRVRIHAALGVGRYGPAYRGRVYARVSRNAGDHARRTTMRAVVG